MDGDRDWAKVKEILVWVINTHRGNLVLYSKQQLEILSLLAIPTTQHHISVKNMERLISKLCYIHLAVLGAIGHFYAMQVAITRTRASKSATANLTVRFHQEIKFWRSLCVKMTNHPTYLAEIFHWAASGIGYTYALGKGTRGIYTNPNEDGINFTCRRFT